LCVVHLWSSVANVFSVLLTLIVCIHLCRMCDARAVDSHHHVNLLTVGQCGVNPDPRANGTYYLVTAESASTYLLFVACNSNCSTCGGQFLHTLDVCVPGFFSPSNTSVVLSTEPCLGGIGQTGTVGLTDVSLLHYDDNQGCYADLSSSVTNLGAANGSCVMVRDFWVKVQGVNATTAQLWWNCSSSDCSSCNVTALPVSYGACLPDTVFSFNGSFQLVQTSTLATCQAPQTTTTTAAPTTSPTTPSFVYISFYDTRDNGFNNT
jgi:hypothetical protein